MKIRRAQVGDAGGIVAIANPIIRDTVITFTTEEKSVAGTVQAMQDGQPFWVAEASCGIVGYATLFPFRSGPGYARTREHTIGLLPSARGQGAGRCLMDVMLAEASAQGVHSVFAGVSGENRAGIDFHTALGFREVARLPEVGWKFGRWHDLVLMQKILSDVLSTG
ncbi:phosphinothricin acetyltransferase [Aliiruegeria haliotis]|uniref:Phosphinothricin acetyltransferase n=1 Tax=Aliiruegeria haliotis TaxID=1280846 RepID=A0A2T0RV66_9RHOB|nr:GNAT family N-acetyltransferase [Aliiruegeria haliotis]PRY25047.1 phosphinothricin acetyltransferase [Aliiruegeria haliotis]